MSDALMLTNADADKTSTNTDADHSNQSELLQAPLAVHIADRARTESVSH